MKTKIDIERLVQWAMREELPKGQAVSASPWQIVMQFAALGVHVDTSGHGDGLGFLAGEPHRDALIVADAIRALDTEAHFDHVEDVLALFGEFESIAHDAARSIVRSSFDPRALVMSCSTMGSRPKWKFEHPHPYQMFAPAITGRPRALVYGIDDDGDLVEVRSNPKDGRFKLSMSPRSPINWHDPSLLHIGECRAEWVTWHHALVKLAADLAGALDAFEVQSLALPLMPWDVEGQAPRILAGRDLSRADVELRLVPKRAGSVLPPIESPIEAETVASYGRASREKMRRSAAI
jgi:hypothetical protein